MDFSKNIKAYLTSLPNKMNGSEKFLATALYCLQGDLSQPTTTQEVQAKWQKSILKIKYNPSYYHDAQKAGWVNSLSPGMLKVTEDGLNHLVSLAGVSSISDTAGSALYVFDKKNTHTFDKFLRGVFSSAKSHVWIADSYVDETIFDTVLDSISKKLPIKLIYGRQLNTFNARTARFKAEYPSFEAREFKRLHDRFMVVDESGYITGPSIKDAADRSPALVVKLNQRDSNVLKNFFQSLWQSSK